MQAVRSFFIAFSMYSKIPVPQFAWEEKDMKYIFCFFPWVGAAVGGVLYLWFRVCDSYHIGTLCRTAVGAAIPLVLTGGIHMDGFMDTMDALHSYSPRERKLEILKDSHIGAFAVIMLAVYGLIFLGAFSELREEALQNIVCGGFFLSRCFCGISVVSFPLAKKDGMLYLFADRSLKKAVKASLYVQSAACIAWMLRRSFFSGLAVAAAAVFVLVYYYHRSRKEFGGVTGDTSGYFVVLCEGCMTAAAALINCIILS